MCLQQEKHINQRIMSELSVRKPNSLNLLFCRVSGSSRIVAAFDTPISTPYPGVLHLQIEPIRFLAVESTDVEPQTQRTNCAMTFYIKGQCSAVSVSAANAPQKLRGNYMCQIVEKRSLILSYLRSLKLVSELNLLTLMGEIKVND